MVKNPGLAAACLFAARQRGASSAMLTFTGWGLLTGHLSEQRSPTDVSGEEERPSGGGFNPRSLAGETHFRSWIKTHFIASNVLFCAGLEAK